MNAEHVKPDMSNHKILNGFFFLSEFVMGILTCYFEYGIYTVTSSAFMLFGDIKII